MGETSLRIRPFVPVVVVLTYIALAVLRFDEFVVGSMGDDAVYAELARSISEGKGPILYFGPGQGVSVQSHPLGYPLILSPIAWLFPNSLDALKLVSAMSLLGLVAVFHQLLRPILDYTQRWSVIALILLNPWSVAYSNRVFSEATYLLISIGTVLLFDRWLRGKLFSVWLFALAAGTIMSVAIRSIGIALIIGIGIQLVLTGRWRRLVSLSVVQALPLLFVISLIRPSGSGFLPDAYLRQILSLDVALWDRLVFMAWSLFYYLPEVAALMIPAFGQSAGAIADAWGAASLYTWIARACGFALLVSSLVGLLHGRWREAPALQALSAYQAVFLIVLFNWTFIPVDRPGGWVELRLLIPLLPVLYLFSLGTITSLLARLGCSSYLQRAIPVAMTILLLSISISHNTYRVLVPFKDALLVSGRGFIDFSVGSGWLDQNAGPEDIVMTSSRLERHIHHRRPTIDYVPFSAVDHRVAQYVFVGPNDPNHPMELDPLSTRVLSELRAAPDRFALAAADSIGKWSIYRILPASSSSPR